MDRAKAVAGLIACLLGASCGPRNYIVVGSKDFTEQEILAEIAAQQIERKLGVEVERKLNLGGTLLAHQSLVKGEIDLYPEYSGTALTAVLKQPVSRDAAAVEAKVRGEYRSRWNLEWMPSLGFNNTFAMVIRGGFETLSQAAARAQPWKLGIGYEFLTRPDGLRGLESTYGLRLDGSPRSMALGLLYQALKQQQVEMVAGNTTDGPVAAMGLTILRDDKGYFPPYEAAFVVREAAMQAKPGLREAIDGLSGKISTDAMRKMNYEVDGRHRAIREVAKEFLNGR
jgi:osmoprotectant transport system substrate-binding protein